MECTECGGQIKIPEDPMPGEIVTCPDCGSSFELAKDAMDKFHLKPALVEGEDWGE